MASNILNWTKLTPLLWTNFFGLQCFIWVWASLTSIKDFQPVLEFGLTRPQKWYSATDIKLKDRVKFYQLSTRSKWCKSATEFKCLFKFLFLSPRPQGYIQIKINETKLTVCNSSKKKKKKTVCSFLPYLMIIFWFEVHNLKTIKLTSNCHLLYKGFR